MSYTDAAVTIMGSGLFTFLVIMYWGKFVDKIGVIGGFLSSMIIPGTMWVLNHGIDNHLIIQTGSVWIDMAVSVGVGVFISSKIQGGKVRMAQITISAVLLASMISGYILVKL